MRLDNVVVSAILSSPVHALLSRAVILLRYQGRRSRRLYTIPVQYATVDGDLLLFAMGAQKKQWWRNLRDQPDVEVLLRGVWRPATSRLVHGDETLARRYAQRFRSARRLIQREEQPVFVVLTPAERPPPP
jgi:deazaflavin-dependent oxidoreductase (nitroreductase family)